MEDVKPKPLTPVKTEGDDKIIETQTLAGPVKMELTPVSEASSSTFIDMKDIKPLTLVKGVEADRKLVTQTQLGVSGVKLETADETKFVVPNIVSIGSGDQKPVPLSNEDTKEKTTCDISSNLPLMNPKNIGKKKAHHATSSVSKGRDQKKTSDQATPQNATSSATPIWFTLLAFQDQDTDAPLPQIPSRYLKVKDGNLPVSYVQKYVAMKLRLESENEVELYLRSLPLDPSMLLSELLGYWIATASPQTITTRVGASGADYMLVLSYGRKAQPESS